jgi:hypothetical protein
MAKSKKMDGKLIAAKEKTQSEVNYIHNRYKVPKLVLKAAIKKVGISRRKVYAELRELGYNIPLRKKKK